MAIRRGNNGSFAQSEIKTAWLSSEFGENYARKIFGKEIDALPRYVRGKRKGKIKGQLTWRKITKGGWVSGYGLVKPGRTFAHAIWEMPWGEEPVLVIGPDTYDVDEANSSL